MKSNTKIRLIYCALFCLLAPTSFIFAQSTDEDEMYPPPPPINSPQEGKHMGLQKIHREMYPIRHSPRIEFHKRQDYMLKRIQENLNLTDDQVKAVRALHKSMAEKRKAAMESIRAQKDAGMKEILTDEQYKTYTERCVKREEFIKEHRGPKHGHGNQAPRCQ